MDEKRNDPIIEAEQNTGAEENELVLTLKKPYEFEGKTYTTLDLSGLENVTAGTLETSARSWQRKPLA